MKHIVLMCLPFLTGSASAQQALAPKTEDQKTLYALGVALGRNISVFDLSPAEAEYVAIGLKDSIKSKILPVSLQEYAPKIEALAKARQAVQTKKFLDKASKEKGVVLAPSGLIYTEIKRGTGKSPKPTDTVRVQYEGTFIDGTVFDSSIRRGKPAEFPLNGVIPCWTEGLQKVKVGGKAKLVCPSKIAYGEEGRPPAIPGGATLVFTIELLDIVKN